MRTSLLASTLGAILISISALATPVFAHGANTLQAPTAVRAASLSMQRAVTQPTNPHIPSSTSQALSVTKTALRHSDYRVAQTLKKNGTKVREFTEKAEKDWYNQQSRQRHPHIMQS